MNAPSQHQDDTFGEGVLAFKDNLGRDRNPYPDPTSQESRRWDDGWTWMRDRK